MNKTQYNLTIYNMYNLFICTNCFIRFHEHHNKLYWIKKKKKPNKYLQTF